ncbi:MAG: DUF4258 domain-containing protein [Blastocatellia bacterium]|nr:DUF4258 domain-containing protein [Blastocatellia bacterium]
MDAEQELLERIKRLIGSNKYRVRIHAVRHMIEEGFSEENMVEAVTGKSKILEAYTDESRCLILGRFSVSEKTKSPLHIVCDYSKEELVDIITAYIPQKPWWVTPTRRGRTL